MAIRTEIVRVQLEDGTEIMVSASAFGGEEDVAALDRVLPFKQVTDTIAKIAKAVVASLDKAKPDKASVEFGVAVGVESGALSTFLVKGTGSGNLKITLEWVKEQEAPA
jgi:hypothetical protein